MGLIPDRQQMELLERGVRALERLAQDPVIEVEAGPPVCPHCERMNPAVRVAESEASGPLGEFVIQAQCLHCSNVFYAFPRLWDSVKTQEELRQLVEERAAVSNYDSDSREN